MIRIREFQETDWPPIWQFMEPVIRAGETYPYAMDMTADQARRMWLDVAESTYVAEDDGGTLLGTFYIKPNQPTLGAHVANCGYMVASQARGRGVATAMCEHSQAEAVRLGYRAMQFNLVVEPNEASVYLWKKLGFSVVGRLPGAFNHPQLGFVDAFIMYKELV
jgi:L-amino acid N-acyltransferase YncA